MGWLGAAAAVPMIPSRLFQQILRSPDAVGIIHHDPDAVEGVARVLGQGPKSLLRLVEYPST